MEQPGCFHLQCRHVADDDLCLNLRASLSSWLLSSRMQALALAVFVGPAAPHSHVQYLPAILNRCATSAVVLAACVSSQQMAAFWKKH